MKKVTSGKILKKAKKLTEDGKSWHFHILSPGCRFNKNKKFALIFEDTENKEEMIHLSLVKPFKTGQKLIELLHGEKITKKKQEKSSKQSLSPRVKQMVEKAKELNVKGFSWHHHLLFPNCIFNKDSRYWTLIFESPIDGETIEERSSTEPKRALQEIEPLFYLQSKKAR